MEHDKEAPWIFVLRDEMLPGRFSIQPIQPSVPDLLELDPEGDILFHSYVALLAATAEYEQYKTDGWIKRREWNIETLAKFIAERLKKTLDLKRVFVIPQDEFNRRVYRGEFEEARTPTAEERLKMGTVFHEVMGQVLDNYYRGLSKERQEVVLLRMRPHDVDGIKRMWGFCAMYDIECGGLRWRYVNKPEILKLSRRSYPLPSYWRSWPRQQERRA
jgi:hypothetical protein